MCRNCQDQLKEQFGHKYSKISLVKVNKLRALNLISITTTLHRSISRYSRRLFADFSIHLIFRQTDNLGRL